MVVAVIGRIAAAEDGREQALFRLLRVLHPSAARLRGVDALAHGLIARAGQVVAAVLRRHFGLVGAVVVDKPHQSVPAVAPEIFHVEHLYAVGRVAVAEELPLGVQRTRGQQVSSRRAASGVSLPEHRLNVGAFADKHQHIVDKVPERPCGERPLVAVRLCSRQLLRGVQTAHGGLTGKGAQLRVDLAALEHRAVGKRRDCSVWSGMCVGVIALVILRFAENDVAVAVFVVALHPHQRDCAHGVAAERGVGNVACRPRDRLFRVIVRVKLIRHAAVVVDHVRRVVPHEPHVRPRAVAECARRVVHRRRCHAHSVEQVLHARAWVCLALFHAVAISLRPLPAQFGKDGVSLCADRVCRCLHGIDLSAGVLHGRLDTPDLGIRVLACGLDASSLGVDALHGRFHTSDFCARVLHGRLDASHLCIRVLRGGFHAVQRRLVCNVGFHHSSAPP